MSDESRSVEIETDAAVLRARIDMMREQISRIERDIHGNGSPGLSNELSKLKSELSSISSKLEAIPEQQERMSDSDIQFRFKILYWATGLMATTLVGLASRLAFHWITKEG